MKIDALVRIQSGEIHQIMADIIEPFSECTEHDSDRREIYGIENCFWHLMKNELNWDCEGRSLFGIGLAYYKMDLEIYYAESFQHFTAALNKGVWEAAAILPWGRSFEKL